MSEHTENYFQNIRKISQLLDIKLIDQFAEDLKSLRNNKGRVFFLGVGGSAANCSHAVNDFRKLCKIESYAPTDNVSELTARINDEGWDSSLVEWLKISNLNERDSIFILSVGGGNEEKKVSVN
ncbi:SIS domain-containing protein, partial [Alphaproteobacteria bacterium]|nr:SIS domain-containing protein [Alphaproteobacteria bacterium]